MNKRQGFTIVEIVIIIAVIAIVAAIGYMAYTNLGAKTDTEPAANTSSSSSETSKPVTVESTSDLDKVSSDLDALPIDDSDSAEFESKTNNF